MDQAKPWLASDIWLLTPIGYRLAVQATYALCLLQKTHTLHPPYILQYKLFKSSHSRWGESVRLTEGNQFEIMALLHHSLDLVLVACAIWNLTNAASLELSSGMCFILALLIWVSDFIVRKNLRSEKRLHCVFEISVKVFVFLWYYNYSCECVIRPNLGCQKHTSDYFRVIMLSETITVDEKPFCRWRWRPISKLFDIGTIRSAMNDNDLVWLVSPDWIALNKRFTNR